MENVIIINGAMNGDQIDTDISAQAINEKVMQGNIMVIKNAFPAEMATALRDLAFSWGKTQEVSDHSDFYELKDKNHFCTQHGVSKFQKTLHHYNSYNFNDTESLASNDLKNLLFTFYAPLKNFYNSITGNQADFKVADKFLHPQIIHYPSGGGFFAKHIHAIEPQKIGVIVSLSQYGKDYKMGGTGFEVDGNEVDIESLHSAGDIALFRYDLPHWVSSVDIEQEIRSDLSRGRWTLIIPFY